MKINQVEQLVGITKGNIRFYEKEGLLTPGRNNENGYRDYSDADVVWLKKIKLLRMLDIPIEEILRLKSGGLTLEDAMGRHIIQLQRRQANLEAAQGVCAQIRDSRSQLDTLDADGVLASMERQEQEGTKFMNVGKNDKLTRYVSPVGAAVVVLAMMAAVLALIVWGFTVDAADAPPIGVVVTIAAVPVIVIIGVLAALYQRIKQIRGGEEDAAAQY
ncbi:MAG: MerR family transcriptional regulator [Oscillospiraceae bacterium]|nr:MerR family transcriptional regulator [Oscillospiraceae bacterium]MCI9308553.1 MerR family transcriptional regulator [Oscillospiraceae bacterium]MCI9549198.1 MerR family transcriptional regulator [Oscillospiraceae bacterium]